MTRANTNFIHICIFLISLSSILQWTVLPINNTFIWWSIYAFILVIVYKSKFKVYDIQNRSSFNFIKLYLLWNIICVARGFFVAEDYWEWKHLISTAMVLLLPLIAFTATNTFYNQKIINSWIKIVLPTFILIALFIDYGAYGRYLIPISFVLIFFPMLNTNWKIISLLIGIFVITIDLGARSNVIKFLVPFLIGLIYYFRSSLTYRILVFIRVLFLFSPFILLYLGITNTFNVFKMNDYIKGEYRIESHAEWEGDGDLTVDTRTFIYQEVIFSALKYNYSLFGRTPARGNESPSFGWQIDKELKRNKNERFTNEVGIANIFTWTGLLGVFFNFLIFVKASYLGLKKSNSWAIKLLAIYVSFRWFYSWVEDFSRFDLSTVFLWICIGMCLSKSFRRLNDFEFRNWIRGIFDKRYRNAILVRKMSH